MSRLGASRRHGEAASPFCKPNATRGYDAVPARRATAPRGGPIRPTAEWGGEGSAPAEGGDAGAIAARAEGVPTELVATLVLSQREGAALFDEACRISARRGRLLCEAFPQLARDFARFFDEFPGLHRPRFSCFTGSNTPYQSHL